MTDKTTRDALLDATGWPTTPEQATADQLIIHAARLALAQHAVSERDMRAYMQLDREDPAYRPALHRWLDSSTAFVVEAQVAYLLAASQDPTVNRPTADELARGMWEITEDGGSLVELMWDYLDNRGIDAAAVWAIAQESAEARP